MFNTKYRVVTVESSWTEAKRDNIGNHILMETNNFEIAKRECKEWSDRDDIDVYVIDRDLTLKYYTRGTEDLGCPDIVFSLHSEQLSI